MKNYYEILGVNHYSSENDIRKAYFKLAKEYHPDVNSSISSEKIFKGINEAYAVLSDSLRRADYDQMLERNFVKEKMEHARTAHKEEDVNEPSKKVQFAAAFGRMIFSVVAGGIVGFLIEFLVWYLIGSKTPLVVSAFYPTIIWGSILGLFWGADLNFNVEEFLGPGYLGRTYTFLRTFIFAISFAYLGGRLFGVLSHTLKSSLPSLIGVTLGIILGGSLGSQGNGVFMLKDNEGRFGLFYTAIRGILIGLVGLIIAVFIATTLKATVGLDITIIASYVGFLLGVIIGSISPPNLSAYASYASSAVKNFMIIIVAIASILIGIVFSYIFHDQIQSIITGIFK